METPKPNNNTEQLKQQIIQAEKELNEKTRLNWIERRIVKKLIKQNKKLIKKAEKQTREDQQKETELKTKVTTAILEMKEFLDIEIEEHNEQGQPTGNTTEATQETLTNLPLNKQIEVFEEILNELQKII